MGAISGERGEGGRASGLRMPAEWAPHERTLIAWPAREAAWRGTTIEEARDVHTQVVAAIAAFEPVTLVADPAHADEARRRVTADNVELVALPIDDSWLRDSGPIVVAGPDGRRAGIDFRFNAWGKPSRRTTRTRRSRCACSSTSASSTTPRRSCSRAARSRSTGRAGS